MADLSVEFCGVRFENPVVLASGVLGITGDGMARVVNGGGAGGVTTKSLWSHEHKGHPNPTMIGNEDFFMNAVGLPDAGPEKAVEEVARYRQGTNAPLIANIVGGVMEDFVESAGHVADLNPDIIEVNISCPNVKDEFGKPMACSVIKAAEVTELVIERLKEKNCKAPVVVKLAPAVDDIVGIAEAVLDAGADGLTCFNTWGAGLLIDIETAQPVLANKVGGVSGPGLLPLNIKKISDICKAKPGVPMIGTGSITTGRDAIQMMMVGATLIGVGTAVYYRGQDVFAKIVQEMNDWCDANGVKAVRDIIGKAQDNI